jgi:hypothetical protein
VLPAEKTAELTVRLAQGEADALSGCFLSVRDDLSTLVARAGEIVAGDLYQLRLRRLGE